jgi:signal transduction histidine kinase
MSFTILPAERMPFSRVRQALAPLKGPALLSIAYFLGAQAAFYIGTLSDQIFALFWPPNVVLFCALMIVPHRNWWRYIAAALPAHAIAELGVGMPASQMLVAFATNCLVALFNAYGVRRYVGDPPWFGSFHKAFIYIVITAGIGPALAACGGAFVPIMGDGALGDYWIFWSHWYLANALPNVTLGPVFLIWFSDGATRTGWTLSTRHLEPAVLTVILIAVCVIAAFAAGRLTTSFLPAVLFLPLPVILWATVRFGEKGASGAILVVAVILTWRTLHGRSLFPAEDPERSVLALQLFLTGLSIPVLLLGAVIDELQRAERTMRQLAAAMVRAQDGERRRIARDLHDSTGQNLIAATLMAGRIENVLPESARGDFTQLQGMLQQSIRELRTVSYLLHPPLLDEAGLRLALQNFVGGFIARSGITVQLDIAPDIDRLPPDMELVLFRVVQEALTNVSRHSHSPTASIHLERVPTASGQDIVLTIKDAGKGMPDTCPTRSVISGKADLFASRGVGLGSMRERLHQIGGRLELESTTEGTTLRAVTPLRA